MTVLGRKINKILTNIFLSRKTRYIESKIKPSERAIFSYSGSGIMYLYRLDRHAPAWLNTYKTNLSLVLCCYFCLLSNIPMLSHLKTTYLNYGLPYFLGFVPFVSNFTEYPINISNVHHIKLSSVLKCLVSIFTDSIPLVSLSSIGY